MSCKRTPFTSAARTTLRRTVGVVRQQGSRRIRPTHLLLALPDCELPDQVAEVFRELGVDRSTVCAHLQPRAA